MTATLFTIGHSNRPADHLVELLHRHGVRTLVDIRAFPRSRRFPHFDRHALGARLGAEDIVYRWSGNSLGGFRKPRRDSPNQALTDSAFRGFADYMASDAFVTAVAALQDLARRSATAIMCAEADHRHCHRQFICDYLRDELTIRHIDSNGTLRPHVAHACLEPGRRPPIYNKHEQRDLFAE